MRQLLVLAYLFFWIHISNVVTLQSCLTVTEPEKLKKALMKNIFTVLSNFSFATNRDIFWKPFFFLKVCYENVVLKIKSVKLEVKKEGLWQNVICILYCHSAVCIFKYLSIKLCKVLFYIYAKSMSLRK
jgi:hypothetical protein